MLRPTLQGVATLTAAVLVAITTACGAGGSPASTSPGAGQTAALKQGSKVLAAQVIPVGTCATLPESSPASRDEDFVVADCAKPHLLEVFAAPTVPDRSNLTTNQGRWDAASHACPDVKSWLGYRGAAPLRLELWELTPTSQRKAASKAAKIACAVSAFQAPRGGQSHLSALPAATLKGAVIAESDALPRWGVCATKTKQGALKNFGRCKHGSSQWLVTRQVPKSGTFPGEAALEKRMKSTCAKASHKYGREFGDWVGYRSTTKSWAEDSDMIECLMPLSELSIGS